MAKTLPWRLAAGAWRLEPDGWSLTAPLDPNYLPLHRLNHGLGAVRDVELAKNAGNVILNRLFADKEAFGYLAVAYTLGHQFQNLLLSGRKWVVAGGMCFMRPSCVQLGDEFYSEPGGHHRFPGLNQLDGLNEPIGLDVLEDISSGTRLEHLQQVFPVFVNCENQNGNAGKLGLDRKSVV